MNFDGIDLSKLPPPTPDPPIFMPTWYSDKVLEWADGTLSEIGKPIMFVRPEHQAERLSIYFNLRALELLQNILRLMIKYHNYI